MGFFSNVEEYSGEFAPLPVMAEEGAPPRNIYKMEVTAKYQRSKAGNDMVSLDMEVLEPEEFEGRHVFDHFLFSDEKFKNGGSHLGKTLHNLKRIFSEEFVAELDGDVANDIIPSIVGAMNGLVLGVQVGQREEEYQGKKTTRNSVRDYYAADEFGVEEYSDE